MLVPQNSHYLTKSLEADTALILFPLSINLRHRQN